MKTELFYRHLLDNQRSAVLLLDDNLCISYLNAAAGALLYGSRQKLVSTPLTPFFCACADVEQALRDCLRNGHPYTSREMEIRRVDGHIQVVDYSVVRLGEDGTKFASNGLMLLVEIQPVEQLVRMSREEGWQQAHLATRKLVRGMAHELKNPLVGIKGAAQLLSDSLPDKQWQEYLDVIVDEADRLRGLADRLLGSNQMLSKQLVNVHECLERVRKLAALEQPDLAIVRDYDPSLPPVEADYHQLVQVLLNLVRNAMQALAEHDVADPQVTLRTRAIRQFAIGGEHHRLGLQVDVEDNGPGVPENLRDVLFFPMVSGRADGTGLGLSIAQQIISQLHGLIECDSRPGRTRFSLRLPITTAGQSAQEANQHA